MPKRQRMTLPEWIDSLESDNLGGVLISVGKRSPAQVVAVVRMELVEAGRNHLSVPVIGVEVDTMADEVEMQALNAGWQDEHPTLRLHALTLDLKQGLQWQRTVKTGDGGGASAPELGAQATIADALMAMANANIKAVTSVTRTIDVLNKSLAEREKVTNDMIGEMVKAMTQKVEVEAAAYQAIIESAVEQAGQDTGSSAVQDETIGVLKGLGRMLGLDVDDVVPAPAAAPMSAESIAAYLKANPDAVAALKQAMAS